jgi:hypothetical protein
VRVQKLRVSRVVAADMHPLACLMQAEPTRAYRRQELLFQLDELVHSFLVRHQRISRVLVVVHVVVMTMALPRVREVMAPVRRVSLPFSTIVMARMPVPVAVCMAVNAAVAVRVSVLVAFPALVALRMAVHVAMDVAFLVPMSGSMSLTVAWSARVAVRAYGPLSVPLFLFHLCEGDVLAVRLCAGRRGYLAPEMFHSRDSRISFALGRASCYRIINRISKN